MEGFDIQEQDGSFLLGFNELFVVFEPVASLVKRVYAFGEIRLGLPYGLVMVRPDGSLNLAELQLTPEPQAEETVPVSPEDPSKDSGELPSVLIEQISIRQGMVEFWDTSNQTPFVADIVPINIMLEHFSTQKGRARKLSGKER